jgi:hypothetical protein
MRNSKIGEKLLSLIQGCRDSWVMLLLIAAFWTTPSIAQSGFPESRYYPAPGSLTTAQCVAVTVDALASLGWRIQAPNASRVLALSADGAVSAEVRCEGGKAIIAASNPRLDREGKLKTAALKSISDAIRQRAGTERQDAGGAMVTVPQLSGFRPTWYTGPIEPRIIWHRVAYPFPVRCVEAWPLALDRSFLDFRDDDSGYSRKRADGVFLSLGKEEDGSVAVRVLCDRSDTQILAQTDSRDFAKASAVIAQKVRSLDGTWPRAAQPPTLSLWRQGVQNQELCFRLGEAMLRKREHTISALPGGLSGQQEGYVGEAGFLCGPAGQMAIWATRDLDYETKDFYDLKGDPAKLPPSQNSTFQRRPESSNARTAMALIDHDLLYPDCRKAAEYAIKEAGYVSPPSAILNSYRKEYSSSAAIDCSENWSVIITATDPFGGLTASGELGVLRSKFEAWLKQPLWAGQSLSREVRLDFPREPEKTRSETPLGPRTTLRARYGGATYSAWITTPSQPAADPQALLDRVVASLEDEGYAVQSVKRASFKDWPSVAVWATRPDEGGAPLRSVARYTITQDNAIVAVEVAFPTGLDVAEELATFSNSLWLPRKPN